MPAKLKIVFMGTPEYASIIFEGLIKSHDVPLAVTQPDKPAGRGRALTPPPVKIAALRADIPVSQPRKLDEAAEIIEEIAPDAIVVAAYGQILSDRALKIAPCLNIHASILPKYRGASPIQACILNGDRASGATLMRMRRGLDTGETLGFAPINAVGKNAAELTSDLARLGLKLLLSALENMESIVPIAQNHAESSLCKKIKKEDGAIGFDRDAAAIERAYRAYFEWPGVILGGDLRLLDISAEDIPAPKKIGEIIAIDKRDKTVTIACLKGAVKIGGVIPRGKNEMGAADYLNGRRLSIGDIFS